MKLLIVDNEEMLVEVMRMGFEAKGVPTVPAYDGQQALDIVKEDKTKEITAILTDITMPKLDGWALIREVSRLRPDIGLIVLSAESEARSIAQYMVETKEIMASFDKSMLSPTHFAEGVLQIVRGGSPQKAG